MKYLRLFEAYSDIELDIKDMLVEVEDYGYITYISNRDYINTITINALSLIKPIKFNDVKDCLMRIKDYLGDRYISCKVVPIVYIDIVGLSKPYISISRLLKLDEDIEVNYNIYSINICYKKKSI